MVGSTDRFGYEWSKFNEIIPEYEIQFLKWIYPLKKDDFKGKAVLDAGCGTGRNSYWPLIYGAKKVTAFDFDKRTTEVARKNLSKFKNSEIIYSSIYDIDYKNEYDIAFSIGVIHHLEDPEKAVENLIRAVKRNGIVLIWVYGYEGNEWIVKYINPIRRITSRFHISLTNIIAYLFSFPFYLFLRVVPQKHPYFTQLSKFKFWHVHSIVFDQLLPNIANYWHKDEVLDLFSNKGLKDIRIFPVNNNSWTILGRKM